MVIFPFDPHSLLLEGLDRKTMAVAEHQSIETSSGSDGSHSRNRNS